MCTISLSYDQSNALARHKLAELLRSGLFEVTYSEPDGVAEQPAPTAEEIETHRELRDAAIALSRKIILEEEGRATAQPPNGGDAMVT